MFKDRVFNLAILFSCVWHLFWISAVGIVITPTVQPSSIYQEADFLGPILEKTAFDFMSEQAVPQAETLYAESTMFLKEIYLKPKGPERKILKEFTPDTVSDKFVFILKDYLKVAKEIPVDFAQDIKMIYPSTADKAMPEIEGPAGEREIIFKPEPLTVPRGLYGDAEEYIVKLKFFVSNNGIVYEVEPLVSSGYPEIDLQGMKFLKGWRFSPSNLIEEQEPDWGVLTVRITAK